MEIPSPQPAATNALHERRARYFRTMALTASTADVAITLVRLAVHYERLAMESAPGATSGDAVNAERPEPTRPRRRRSPDQPG